jgi:hypothetical protein
MSRPALAAFLALAAVAVGLAALLADDGDAGRATAIGWVRGPKIANAARPRDTVAFGQLRNDGRRAVTLDVAELRVVGPGGKPLPSAARFLEAFGPATAGRVVHLQPGATAPLTVAWRGAGALHIAMGAVTLPIAP